MKMTPEHYKQMTQAIDEALAVRGYSRASFLTRYAAEGLSAMRARWDALHFAGIRAGNAHNGAAWPVYDYCNDSHIDTALRTYFNAKETA